MVIAQVHRKVWLPRLGPWHATQIVRLILWHGDLPKVFGVTFLVVVVIQLMRAADIMVAQADDQLIGRDALQRGPRVLELRRVSPIGHITGDHQGRIGSRRCMLTSA